MPGHQLVLKRLIELEKAISLSYKYSCHCLILESFTLLPWLVCTDVLIEKILPILEIRSNAVIKNSTINFSTFCENLKSVNLIFSQKVLYN